MNAETRVRLQIGELVVANAVLSAENEELKAKLAEKQERPAEPRGDSA